MLRMYSVTLLHVLSNNYYKPLPAPPTLTLLIGPLLVIFVALRVGLHIYKAKGGVMTRLALFAVFNRQLQEVLYLMPL